MSRTTAKVVSNPLTRAPSGQALAKIPARRLKRMGALALDVILLPIIWIVASILPLVGPALATIIYMSLMGSLVGSGRSLGRAATEQRLMTREGEPLEHGKAIARNGLRIVLWMTVLPFFVDLFLLLFGDGRLLADRICGTQVYEDLERGASKMSGGASDLEKVTSEAPTWDDRHDQAALEEIASGLAFGDEDEDGAAELAEFERRLRGGSAPEDHSGEQADVVVEAFDAPSGGWSELPRSGDDPFDDEVSPSAEAEQEEQVVVEHQG